MIDLTPLDVRKKRGDFRRILRGYDTEEVDSFLELVGERLEELVKENILLSGRVAGLERNLTALAERENAVQEALVTAQTFRKEVQDQARRDAEAVKEYALREAQLLRAEAEAEVAKRLGEVDGLIQDRRRALEEMERNRRKFLKSFRGLLERELDTVEVEEARAPLEEVALELELRGWSPTGPADPDPDAGVGHGGDEGAGEETPQVVWDEAPEVMREEELEAVAHDGSGVMEEAEPEMLESEDRPVHGSVPEEESGSEEEPVSEGDSIPGSEAPPLRPGRQPAWLFSLLKREGEDEEDEDA